VQKEVEIINITKGFVPSEVPAVSQVATIGFFDGVHRGHCSLLSQVVRQAAQRNRQSTVVTFDIHPRQLVNPDFQPLLLTTLDEKLQLLSLQGIDRVAVLHFDEQMASLSARDFMSVVLSRQLNVDTLVLGYDSRFGHGRTAGFADYEAYGRSMGIDVLRATPLLSDDGTPVSSSLVRNLLLSGNIAQANDALGRRYSLTGNVVDGFHEGRRLGFPTANLALADRQRLVPGRGVYAVWAELTGYSEPMPAMMNIGTRPTYNGSSQTLEVHIIGYEGDLYGQDITVTFAERIRSEQPFDSPSALASQLQLDRKACIRILNNLNK
jgi:riboflavin kinase/FMN adenylyltransferase